MEEFTLLKKNIKLNILEGGKFSDIKAVIIHVHGLGAHFQPLYIGIDEFIERDTMLSKNNFKSFGLEFSGHGKSEGKRCCIYSFEDLIEDLEILVKHVESIYMDIPIFLFCESMGCAVALKYCITRKNNIKGLVFLAPLFGIDESVKPNSILINILLFISYFFPSYQLFNTKSLISSNNDFLIAKEINKYTYHDSLRLCTAREIFLISDWIKENIHLLKIPLIIFHGLRDYLTQPNISKELFEKIDVPNKELHLIENAFHCLLIECKENPSVPNFIMEKSIDWIKKIIL